MKYSTPCGSQAQELIYKTIGKKEIMLTFLPPAVQIYETAPVYFIIAGGGWHTETRQSMIDFSKTSVDRLRKEGFAVVSPDYRVYKETGVVMEDIISDCFDAARYLAHFAQTLKIDKEKIVVSGHSAGGHLALMLAYAPQDRFVNGSFFQDRFKVAAALPFSPPTILYETKEIPKTLGFDVSAAFGSWDCAQARHRTSPYDYVNPTCPPTVLYAGTEDELVYSSSSQILYEKLRKNGVEAEVYLSFGGGHQFEQVKEGKLPKPTKEAFQKMAASMAVKYVSKST